MRAHVCEVEGMRLSRFALKVAKKHNVVNFIFMHNFHILPFKNVEISTIVRFYQCIFIEYSCIKILYTKCIGKIWKFFGCFFHILPSKNPYTSRLPAILGVMFFWYIALYTNCMKKIFYAILCMFMHEVRVLYIIYNVAKIVPKFLPFFTNFLVRIL